MSTFKDAGGREWLLEITINDVRRIKQLLGFDLLDLDQGQSLQRLATDAILLVDVLWLLCEEQADKHGLSDEQFGRGFRGEVIETASEALFEALVDFFPPQRQAFLKRISQAGKTLGQKQQALMERMLGDDQMEQFIDAEMAKLETKLKQALTAGKSSTNSPASSESTPDHLASDP